MTTKADIEGYVSDLFADFLYYDRKEDEDFTLEDAENLSSIVTQDELVIMFMKEINEHYN